MSEPAQSAQTARLLELARGPEPDDRPAAGAVLFEVAWEVCNQVGGIYQVLKSKAGAFVDRWRDRYCVVGPYVEAKAAIEFEPTRATGWLGRVVSTLRDEGLGVHHGRWLVPGNPRALLLEHVLPGDRLGEVKYRLWKDHGIELPAQDWWMDGAASFGDAVRRLLESVCHFWCGAGAQASGPGGPVADRRVVAHFHEWLGGLALPMVRRQRLPVACAFTTHATLLGRYIASAEESFYDRLPWMDQAAEAAKYNVRTQHAMERACAHGSHAFTTVSAVTAEECTHLLGRTPDVVTPNGLNIRQYYAAHQMQTWHAEYKERIHQFVMGHFFPSYSFDLDKTLYLFTSGRFEPKNKGFDLCLEAMARVNAELRALREQGETTPTIVFFVITQRAARSINPLILEKRGVLNELRQVCQRITESLGEKLFRHGAAGERIHLDDQVDDYWRLRYKRTQFALRTHRLPMVCTHMMEDDANDPVLNHIRVLGLLNRAEDPVKVVYHPEFINPVSPLWGIEYEQFIRGCHMGVFPSLYEPWGYTPLECMACGVPAISSDLAGFGRYARENMMGHEELGLSVLRRRGRSFHDAAADLASTLVRYCRSPRRERIALRNAVERASWQFDWARLAPAYHQAHAVAVQRLDAELSGA